MNFQEKIVELYTSDSLIWKGIGAWCKFLYELSVAALPLAVVLLIVATISQRIRLEFTLAADSIIVVWLSVSLTVTGIMWCFTLSTVEMGEEDRSEQETLNSYEEQE